MQVLDIGTGSGYGCGLLAARFGGSTVTSIDIDPYLTRAASERLGRAGLSPLIVTCDATGELPGEYDRIVAMMSVRPVPASWLRALRPGGRLVTVIGGTSLIVTATKTDDGCAVGRTTWDRAGFMQARPGDRFPAQLSLDVPAEGGESSVGRLPVVDVPEAWDLASMLAIEVPGVGCRFEESNGRRTLVMAHPDGSWARATATGGDSPVVLQGGPRRLWDALDRVRWYWLQHGELPVRRAGADRAGRDDQVAPRCVAGDRRGLI